MKHKYILVTSEITVRLKVSHDFDVDNDEIDQKDYHTALINAAFNNAGTENVTAVQDDEVQD